METAHCPPHDWRLPEVGDTCLVCRGCGMHFDLLHVVTHVRSGITRSLRHRRGSEYARAWGEAFHAARTAYLAEIESGAVFDRQAQCPHETMIYPMRPVATRLGNVAYPGRCPDCGLTRCKVVPPAEAVRKWPELRAEALRKAADMQPRQWRRR